MLGTVQDPTIVHTSCFTSMVLLLLLLLLLHELQ
jgi:hypothetical protein